MYSTMFGMAGQEGADGCMSAQQWAVSGGLEGGREGAERRLVYHDIIGSGWCDGLPYSSQGASSSFIRRRCLVTLVTCMPLTAALLGGKWSGHVMCTVNNKLHEPAIYASVLRCVVD